MAFPVNDNVDNVIDVRRIYNDYGELRKSQKLFFDFQVHYTRAEEEDDDVEEEEDFPDFDNLQTLTLEQTHEFDRDWLFGGDGDHSLAIVYHILDSLQVPPYSAIVNTLADEIKDLKKDGAKDVERVQVKIGVTVSRFPGEDDHVDVQVQLAVAPANDEAVEMHLETLVVENEGYCVICMDNIRVGSDVEAGRMPCSHVFHRTCGEEWLRNSGICPVCRALFPA